MIVSKQPETAKWLSVTQLLLKYFLTTHNFAPYQKLFYSYLKYFKHLITKHENEDNKVTITNKCNCLFLDNVDNRDNTNHIDNVEVIDNKENVDTIDNIDNTIHIYHKYTVDNIDNIDNIDNRNNIDIIDNIHAGNIDNTFFTPQFWLCTTG